MEFYAKIYVIFIIFYTKIINLHKLCQIEVVRYLMYKTQVNTVLTININNNVINLSVTFTAIF